MPSTVYKGDLAEVSFAPETGLKILGETDVKMTLATTDNITTITFSAQQNTALFNAQKLRYPTNILVGSQVMFEAASSSSALNTGDLSTTKDGGRIFTIVKNKDATMEITPAMLTGDVDLGTDDILHILPYKTPPIDGIATIGASAERVATDQFLGIATALTLPETKIDLKRFHVVGLGRDAAIQVPGKLTTEGGSFEVAMHSARWLKYCLGQELLHSSVTSGTETDLHVAAYAGQSAIKLDSITNVSAGSIIEIVGISVPIVTDHEPDGGTWDGTLTDFEFDNALGSEVRRVLAVSSIGAEKTVYLDEPLTYPHSKDAVVRVRDYHLPLTKAPTLKGAGLTTGTVTGGSGYTAVPGGEATTGGTGTGLTVITTVSTGALATVTILNGGKNYTAADVITVSNGTGGSFILSTVSTTGQYPAYHLLYSRSTLPSFSLEVSQRRRDIDSNETTLDGGVGDSKELTRVFRGCKVSDWTLTTDNDAALRLSVNFNAALCYTDTGRLEDTAITRYSTHRMFDDTANTEIKRLQSGIGKGTQKPFMFYNGSINLAGQQVAQVMSMTLTGQTGMQSFHTINGNNQSASAYADQVPFGGARNASLMVEGQTTYEMTMEIAVDDPLFYHKMRTGTEFSVNNEGNSTANQIRIEFEKNLTGNTAVGDSEKMIILIDDYYIVEAPLQIPEDKGVVKSTIKIMPKSIKVLSRDTILKY